MRYKVADNGGSPMGASKKALNAIQRLKDIVSAGQPVKTSEISKATSPLWSEFWKGRDVFLSQFNDPSSLKSQYGTRNEATYMMTYFVKNDNQIKSLPTLTADGINELKEGAIAKDVPEYYQEYIDFLLETDVPGKYSQYLESWLPVAELYRQAQQFDLAAIKRQEKDHPVFKAPPASAAAMGQIKSILEEIVAESFDSLIVSVSKSYMSWAEDFVGKAPESMRGFYKKNPYQAFEESIVTKLVDGKNIGYSANKYVYSMKPNAATIATSMATKVAEDLREAFIYKNLTKLSAIVEKKGNFQDAKKLSGSLESFGFNGEIKFEFTDGTGFRVRNKAVAKYSTKGTFFYQFPTTFHEVRLPDGSVKKMLSEEEMNVIFAKNIIASLSNKLREIAADLET